MSSSQLKKVKKIFQREQFKEAERKKKEVCRVQQWEGHHRLLFHCLK